MPSTNEGFRVLYADKLSWLIWAMPWMPMNTNIHDRPSLAASYFLGPLQGAGAYLCEHIYEEPILLPLWQLCFSQHYLLSLPPLSMADSAAVQYQVFQWLPHVSGAVSRKRLGRFYTFGFLSGPEVSLESFGSNLNQGKGGIILLVVWRSV